MKIISIMRATEILRKYWGRDWRWTHYLDGSTKIENRRTGKKLLVQEIDYGKWATKPKEGE